MLFVPHWVHTVLCWFSSHWGDVVPAWLGVFVAGIFGWLSLRSARRSAAAERESRAAKDEAKAQADRADRATTAAENAAAAADRSAAAAERWASAHEAQTALLQDAADAAERAPWRMVRPRDQDFRLVNNTDTQKYEVDVTGEPARGMGNNHFDVVDGRETVELDLFVAAQTQDRRVTVSWRPTPDHTGDPWTQRLGLPGYPG
ncbi:hypothetical protein [Mycobacterium sp. IEC1808]|uniref:hypothetical protein n=1 Tax=Mycobacterium sp. IEC1808 TaxID=1743230 RepID=UPI0011525C0C|nr:hypothetical protein [Mycobacterium sp. IEC1808]